MPETTAQVRWLVVGPINPTPTGETFTVQRDDFMAWLEKRRPGCEAVIPDGLGNAGERRVSFAVDKLRALSLKEVVGVVPQLGKLLALAGKLGEPEQAVADVEAIVGPGALSDKVAELGEVERKPAPAKTEGDSLLDMAVAPAPEKKTAAAAVDAFLRVASKSPRTTTKSKSARQIRDAIEEAVYREARALLEAPTLSALESSLRGLWLLAGSCRKSAGLLVEVHDVPLAQAVERIRDRPLGDLVDEPDAIFVPFPIADAKLLGELAALGEEMLCPVVVDVAPALLGKKSIAELADAIEELDPKDAEPAWLSLRQEESSRWLCAVANGVVLVSEGTGSARRELIGSGVWAFGAVVSKSYAETGSFARLTGRPGALQGPAVRTIEKGRNEGMATPTEIFIPIRGQARFAKHGIIALGSSRNSDQLVLADAPMARAAADAAPFPAQLLTGRIVRFSRWVREQLPQGVDADTARNVFKEAAKVFLFPGMNQVGEVDATIREIDGKRMLSVYANISPLHAGTPFELAFPLPLD